MKSQEISLVLGLLKFIGNQIRETRVKLFKGESFFYFYLRAKTTDLQVFSETFFNYFPTESLPLIERNTNTRLKKKHLIVDAGACIGTTAALFSIKFPLSHIVALEPSNANYMQLKKNTEKLDNVECLQLALDSNNSYVEIDDVGLGFWGLQTKPLSMNSSNIAQTISVEELLRRYDDTYERFVFKLDIEGGERNLSNVDWDLVVQFKIICIEFHDWMFPSEGLSKYFFQSLARSGINYSLSLKGNNMWIIKL